MDVCEAGWLDGANEANKESPGCKLRSPSAERIIFGSIDGTAE